MVRVGADVSKDRNVDQKPTIPIPSFKPDRTVPGLQHHPTLRIIVRIIIFIYCMKENMAKVYLLIVGLMFATLRCGIRSGVHRLAVNRNTEVNHCRRTVVNVSKKTVINQHTICLSTRIVSISLCKKRTFSN